MNFTRPLIFATALLTLFISACSQAPERAAPVLEPQLGPPGTFSAAGVAFNKTGHLYGLTASSEWYTASGPDEDYEVYNQQATLHRFSRAGTMLWEPSSTTLIARSFREGTQIAANTGPWTQQSMVPVTRTA